MTTEELEQMRKIIREENEPIRTQLYEQGANIVRLVQGQKRLEQDQAHTNTALEAVKAGIDDVQENMATKQDVKRLEGGQEEIKVKLQDTDAKYYKKVREHGQRIDELERHEGLPNPTKH